MSKRQPKNSLSRKSKLLRQYKNILIVCEGEVTEPNYFKSLIHKYKINAANVQIIGKCGSAPMSVYSTAVELYRVSKLKGEVEYDKVYCVFDKDQHHTYQAAVESIRQKKNFEAILSDPCFEVWYLLHFMQSSKPFDKKGSKTASQQVKSEATKLLKKYAKNENDLSILHQNLATAISNAKQMESRGITNPYTNVYMIVEEIFEDHKIAIS